MKRVYTKIGDVFSVKIDEHSKKFFQLIAFDLTQLNSDVIRVFKKNYPLDIDPDLSEILTGEIEFYAHCVTKWGVKLGYWEKVSNISNVGETNHILFRGSNDSGAKPGEQIKISKKWYVWHVNDKNFTFVGELTGENQKAEIGSVIPPDSIIHRIKTGKYDFFYPGFK